MTLNKACVVGDRIFLISLREKYNQLLSLSLPLFLFSGQSNLSKFPHMFLSEKKKKPLKIASKLPLNLIPNCSNIPDSSKAVSLHHVSQEVQENK